MIYKRSYTLQKLESSKGNSHFTFILKHLGSYNLTHFHGSQATTHLWSNGLDPDSESTCICFTCVVHFIQSWLINHIKIKHMANSCRSQKLWSLLVPLWIFSVSEGIFYRTVNHTEWSFSDSEKYSWSQTLLSRESSSFAIIRGTEAPSTKHSCFFNKWHWTLSQPTAAFSVWNTKAVKSQKLQRKLFILFSPWSTDRTVHFLEFCKMTFSLMKPV